MSANEPNPALIVDWLWNLIEANRAASLLWDGVDPAPLEPPIKHAPPRRRPGRPAEHLVDDRGLQNAGRRAALPTSRAGVLRSVDRSDIGVRRERAMSWLGGPA
jgi:hypothetical protein